MCLSVPIIKFPQVNPRPYAMFELGRVVTMWDFSFIIPCALIMVTLFCFYSSKPRPPLHLNRMFLGLLVIELLVLFTDIVSTKVDEMHELFSPATLYLANTAFFVCFVLRIYWFFLFTVDLMRIGDMQRPSWLWVTAVPFFAIEAICLTSFMTGAIFSVQNGAYASGPLYRILGYTYYFYAGLSIILAIGYRRKLRHYDLACIIWYNLALLAGSVIRVLLPKVLVMDTFCTVAITIIYLAFLNPDLYLSEHRSVFNTHCLRLLLKDPSHQSNSYLLGFALQNYIHERSILGSGQMDKATSLISTYLRETFHDEIPFYLRDGRYVLMGGAPDRSQELSAIISKRFDEPWSIEGVDLRFGVRFAYVDVSSDSIDSDRVVNNLVIALDDATHSSQKADDTADGPIDIRQVNKQVDIFRQLEYALANDGVEIFLQPLVNSRTHKMEGAEALARIRDEQGQIVPPGLFIPVAEKSGHINELGRQVLRKTCAFVCSHNMEAMGIKWVNVNLSPIQCMQEDLPIQFEQVLAEYGVAPDLIHLEITEQSMVDFSLVQTQITSLTDEGFHFVLDDYGSG